MTAVKIHEAAELFPMMGDADYKQLKKDIALNGLKSDLVFIGTGSNDRELLDGRNRLKAMQELGIDWEAFCFVEHPDNIPDPVGYVVSLNLHRRHLTDSQRAMIAANIANLKKGSNQHTAIAVSSSQATAAKLMNTSVDSIQRANRVQEHGVPELVEAVREGSVTVSAAVEVSDLDQSEQRELVAAGSVAVRDKASELRRERSTTNASTEVVGQADCDRTGAKGMELAHEAINVFRRISVNDPSRTLGAKEIVKFVADNYLDDDDQWLLQLAWKSAREGQRREFIERHKVKLKPLPGTKSHAIKFAYEAMSKIDRIPVNDQERSKAARIIISYVNQVLLDQQPEAGESEVAA